MPALGRDQTAYRASTGGVGASPERSTPPPQNAEGRGITPTALRRPPLPDSCVRWLPYHRQCHSIHGEEFEPDHDH